MRFIYANDSVQMKYAQLAQNLVWLTLPLPALSNSSDS
nr:MAG TPA: hypothetical protein [Caudoviricetes sp.]